MDLDPVHDRRGSIGTGDYFRHHLKFVAHSGPLFSDATIATIRQASCGYPRAVNNLAVAALIATFAAGKRIVRSHSCAICDHREHE